MPRLISLLSVLLTVSLAPAVDPPPVISDVEGQPLAANAERLAKALEFLGTPLPADTAKALAKAVADKDAKAVQKVLDSRALFVVNINPEARVKAARGPADAVAQQAGYVPFLVKIVNESTVKKAWRVTSPVSGPVYGGPGRNERDPKADPKTVERFLQVEGFTAPPMTGELSGLKVEYALVLVYSSEAGKREATLSFEMGNGNQDLGFRGEVPVLFDFKPAIPVKLKVLDVDGTPTVARFVFTDAAGHVYPPQAKRLAPDFFFHKQVYRADGGTVLLPPGVITVEVGRGPEYKTKRMTFRVAEPKLDPETLPPPGMKAPQLTYTFQLERWIHPAKLGWYSGDHHIHAAGCAHYTSPTEGVRPEDMFLHVKGENLNVGCCLTWGPCYDHQRQFFNAKPWERSEPFTVLKYDVEVSGFGSQALGHVCLLNLKDQTYPGSDGTKTKGWPTWTTPLMTWAKKQGGVTGYAHSGNGLGVNPEKTTRRLFVALDPTGRGFFTAEEATKAALPLPEPFAKIDADGDKRATEVELRTSIDRTLTRLPNLAIPEMNGIGAQEICVTTAMGVCDFISAMDTDRVPEWNCWYHILNCGFPLKVSGETDFPCISGSRVGMGRVYVQLGKVPEIRFDKWCEGIAKGRSYVSDGYAHALAFGVNGVSPGFGEVALKEAGEVTATAKVAFASDVTHGTAPGARTPTGKTREVDLIVNGRVAETKVVPADDKVHELQFKTKIDRSSWVALRSFPQLHTNPVNVIVSGKPIRASADSAKWCVGVIEQLWRVREKDIRPGERAEAKKTFDKAIGMYKAIAADAK